jgi:twitching motility protein PilT
MREVMIMTPAISHLIRTGKTHEIYSAIEMGAREGMISAGRALSDLAKKGLIDPLEAQSHKSGHDLPPPKRRATDFMGPSAA